MEEDEPATDKTLTEYRETITSLIQHHLGRVVHVNPSDSMLGIFLLNDPLPSTFFALFPAIFFDSKPVFAMDERLIFSGFVL